jgi:hypothetical protein
MQRLSVFKVWIAELKKKVKPKKRKFIVEDED